MKVVLLTLGFLLSFPDRVYWFCLTILPGKKNGRLLSEPEDIENWRLQAAIDHSRQT